MSSEKEFDLLCAAEAFVQEHIVPFANQFAFNSKLPAHLINSIASQGFLGTLIATEYAGLNIDYSNYGKLTRLFGYGCSSIRSLLTVHDMVAYAIQYFGNMEQKQKWLPDLAHGKLIAGFALTETGLGSAIDKIQTRLTHQKEHFSLTGTKVWISYGQIADLLLVFAKLNGELPVALLVPASSPGIRIKPINNAFGLSASMLAEIHFDNVLIAPDQLLGKPGMGLSFIANRSLTLGRYSVACGCLGIIDACINATKQRIFQLRPDGNKLIDFQLVADKVTEMLTSRKIVALLCENAGKKLNENFVDALEDVMMAKYIASKLAYQTANDTLQIYGAEGYREESAIRRYLQDAKVCELIEGSNEIMRALIGKSFIGNYTYERNYA